VSADRPEESAGQDGRRLAAVRHAYGPEAIVASTSGAYFSRSITLALAPPSSVADLDHPICWTRWSGS
jgi:hypothetical protein